MATTDKPQETTPEKAAPAKATATEESAPDPREFVLIRHKDQAEDVNPGRVTRRAFDTIWQAKGYEIVQPSSTTATEGAGSE